MYAYTFNIFCTIDKLRRFDVASEISIARILTVISHGRAIFRRVSVVSVGGLILKFMSRSMGPSRSTRERGKKSGPLVDLSAIDSAYREVRFIERGSLKIFLNTRLTIKTLERPATRHDLADTG